MEQAQNAQQYKKAFEQMLDITQKHAWRPNWICKVKSVDRNARTCEVEAMSGEVSFSDAALCATESDSSDYVVQYPKVDSVVLVELVEKIDTQAVVIMQTEVEEIDIVIGQTKINIKDGLIKFNDGNNKGLVLLMPVLKAINDIQKDLNTLKQVFAGWIPAAQDGGAALKGAASTWAGQQLTLTTQQDIENDKIKQ